MDDPTKPNNPVLIPIAIVLAGLIIGGAIYLKNPSLPPTTGEPELVLEKLRPVERDDHIRGQASAPIVVLEYSDLECPFCKNFNQTMQKIMSEFGPTGQVAWVYRHFPLQIHSQAQVEAMATECVAELAGEEAFWSYHDKIFEITPSNNGLDLTQLPKLATELGIKLDDFNNCLNSNRHADRVENDLKNAIESGGTGTPFNLIIDREGKPHYLGGAIPLEELRGLINSLL